MTEGVPGQFESVMANMRAARKQPAVLKTELMTIRSALPDTPLFVLEGKDDKVVYYQWVKRISPDLRWHPYVCSGKKYVLSLLDSVKRDRGTLGRGIYFFIDRDFDDLQGHVKDSMMFMTEYYSVENYLVSQLVVDEILKIDFHCENDIVLCAEIVSSFADRYEEFLVQTRDINERLFMARRAGVDLSKEITEKISDIALVTLSSVAASSIPADEVISLSRPIPPHLVDGLAQDFKMLDAKQRYRGKFAYKFLQKWLDLLATEHRGREGFFAHRSNNSRVNINEIGLHSLASKSDMPTGLPDFIAGVCNP